MEWNEITRNRGNPAILVRKRISWRKHNSSIRSGDNTWIWIGIHSSLLLPWCYPIGNHFTAEFNLYYSTRLLLFSTRILYLDEEWTQVILKLLQYAPPFRGLKETQRTNLFLTDPVFSNTLIIKEPLQRRHKRHSFVFVTQGFEEWAIWHLWRIEQRYRRIGNVIWRVSLSSVLKWFDSSRLLGKRVTVLSIPWLTLSRRLNRNS